MKIPQVLRQGDITLIRIGDAIETVGAKPTVIALGKLSGHWHTANVIDRIVHGIRTISVPIETTMRVEPASHNGRHEPLVIPAGKYRIPGTADQASIWLGQREYTPEAIRGVSD